MEKGTTQWSVSGPYLFSIFIDDLNIKDPKGNTVLVKYADDSTIISPVIHKDNVDIDHSARYVESFLDWTSNNGMKCNTSKCKEIIFRKKQSLNNTFSIVSQIPQTSSHKLLGITFQADSRFNYHIKEVLATINKGLFIIDHFDSKVHHG